MPTSCNTSSKAPTSHRSRPEWAMPLVGDSALSLAWWRLATTMPGFRVCSLPCRYGLSQAAADIWEQPLMCCRVPSMSGRFCAVHPVKIRHLLVAGCRRLPSARSHTMNRSQCSCCLVRLPTRKHWSSCTSRQPGVQQMGNLHCNSEPDIF